MTDYLERASEAAREAEQRVRSTWPPPSPARVLTAILRAAEPFIAEHHRGDERERVKERAQPVVQSLRNLADRLHDASDTDRANSIATLLEGMLDTKRDVDFLRDLAAALASLPDEGEL